MSNACRMFKFCSCGVMKINQLKQNIKMVPQRRIELPTPSLPIKGKYLFLFICVRHFMLCSRLNNQRLIMCVERKKPRQLRRGEGMIIMIL